MHTGARELCTLEDARFAPFVQQTCIDPRARLVPKDETPRIAARSESYREIEASIAGGQPVDLVRHFHTAFRYRDPAILPSLRRAIDHGRDGHFLAFLWSIAVLGDIGEHVDSDRLFPLLSDPNPLVREYAASAMGKLARPEDLRRMSARRGLELDGYVQKTLDAALRRASDPTYGDALSVREYESTGLMKLRYFYNAGIDSDDDDVQHEAKKRPPAAVADRWIYPHQQYRRGLTNTPPLRNFGGRFHHVGEDSGWMMMGLPVHAVADSVVAMIQHDLSWGCLVATEIALPDGSLLTVYYAHLSQDLDVKIGQRLSRGDKIGEIGPSLSIENGGYWSHLHLGIEDAGYEDAEVSGYDEDIGHYRDPVTFIGARP
jgi:murein DD-endopeptidase MepM/ murein hydrolase activator NlpD